MSKRRRAYPPEFRRQMVELVRSGRKAEELSREFEPTAQAIRNWVAQADRDEGRRADGLTTAERQEPGRLRWENRCGLRRLFRKYGVAFKRTPQPRCGF
jgi:transposase